MIGHPKLTSKLIDIIVNFILDKLSYNSYLIG